MSHLRVAVATSGGRDSTALLHATVRALRPLGGEVIALHVHHGLQAAADGWVEQVRQQARRWGAGFDHRRLAGSPAPGDSVEAWARQGRYAALAEMARAARCDLVLLAHHRRDQAETWLLQALRGGTMAGLAAMPTSTLREGLVWARPWLHRSRSAIDGYVLRHRLRCIEDLSNTDPRYARNRLRHLVWPALQTAFPDAEVALVQAAARAHEAAALAAEVVQMDLPACTHGSALTMSAWMQLPPARRLNVLRGWLAQVLGRGAPQTLIERLMREAGPAGHGCWETPSGTLRLYRGLLQLDPGVIPVPGAGCGRDAPLRLTMTSPGIYPLVAWGGAFHVSRSAIDAEMRPMRVPLLDGVRVAARAGGERFRLAPGAAARSLKKQFQACGVPAWQRAGPLLFDSTGQLLFVPGLGVEACAVAGPGEAALHIQWRSSAPLAQEQLPLTG